MSMPPTPDHDRQLDAARGGAALTVTLCHLLEFFWAPHLGVTGPIAHWVATVSQHAVLVFFLLSGFLISRNIQRNMARNGCFVPSDYWLGRLARIYPPLLATLLLCGLIHLLISQLGLPGSPAQPLASIGRGMVVDRVLALTPEQFVRALLLLHASPPLNIPLWSLFVEIKLYLIAGLLATTLAGRGIWRGPALLLAAGVAWSGFDLQGRLFLAYVVVWGSGAGLALLADARWRWRITALISGLSLLVLIGMAIRDATLLSFLYAEGHGPRELIVPLVLGLSGLALALPVFALRWPAGLVAPLAWLAPFSYSVYLINWPLMALVLSLTQGWMALDVGRAGLVSAASLLAVLLAARQMAQWTEKPARFQSWLRRGLAHRGWAGESQKNQKPQESP